MNDRHVQTVADMLELLVLNQEALSAVSSLALHLMGAGATALRNPDFSMVSFSGPEKGQAFGRRTLTLRG